MCTCKSCMMKEEGILNDQKLHELYLCVCVYIPAGNRDTLTSQTVCQNSFNSLDECRSTV